MLLALGVFVIVVWLLLLLAMVCTPALDPRDYGDHLNPELTGNAGVSELVELAARVRKESKGHE